MKRTTSGLILLVLIIAIALAFPWQPAHATPSAQSLPPASWYAVVWDQGADTLHWINASGEVASRARPHLPDEASTGTPDMRISPNGRYLVETGRLNTGLMAVGIFDFQNGNWVQVHIASPGEEINLGGRYIFDPNSTHVAVGFMVADYSAPTWHVSVFDLASGAELASLNSGAITPATTPPQLQMPHVRYYTVDSAGEVVHIQLIRYGTEGQETWPAYAWYPFAGGTTPTVSPSPYTRAEGDVHFSTGEEIFAFYDPNYTRLTQVGPGPSYNAIGRAMPTLGTPAITTVWVDGTNFHYSAQWAKNNEWVLFWTDNGAGQRTWKAAYTNVSPNTSTLLGPTVTDVAGTPDGYLKVTTSLSIYHVTDLMDYLGGTQVFQASGPGPLRIVYVTPAGASFTLTNLGVSINPGALVTLNPGVIVTIPPVPMFTLQPSLAAPAIMCPGAPPPRLTVGGQARVTFTDGTPLRVRATPGGSIITQLPEGTVIQVIGGPQCQGQYTWWQIQTTDGIQGWSAEGDMESYYLEPWAELAPPPQQPTSEVFVPLATLPPAAVVTLPPLAVATVPPLVLAPPAVRVTLAPPIAGDCSLAPQTRLQVGDTAVTAESDGTYAFRENLSDPYPQYQIPPQTWVYIVGGPACKDGYRFWQVELTLNGQTLTGWLSEGTQQKYFLLPVVQ